MYKVLERKISNFQCEIGENTANERQNHWKKKIWAERWRRQLIVDEAEFWKRATRRIERLRERKQSMCALFYFFFSAFWVSLSFVPFAFSTITINNWNGHICAILWVRRKRWKAKVWDPSMVRSEWPGWQFTSSESQKYKEKLREFSFLVNEFPLIDSKESFLSTKISIN